MSWWQLPYHPLSSLLFIWLISVIHSNLTCCLLPHLSTSCHYWGYCVSSLRFLYLSSAKTSFSSFASSFCVYMEDSYQSLSARLSIHPPSVCTWPDDCLSAFWLLDILWICLPGCLLNVDCKGQQPFLPSKHFFMALLLLWSRLTI